MGEERGERVRRREIKRRVSVCVKEKYVSVCFEEKVKESEVIREREK
jgi:hypothetical protein